MKTESGELEQRRETARMVAHWRMQHAWTLAHRTCMRLRHIMAYWYKVALETHSADP